MPNDFRVLKNADHWTGDPLMRAAFKKQMRGRQYGPDALIDAWCWFAAGWKARANI